MQERSGSTTPYRCGARLYLLLTLGWSATFWLLSPLLAPRLEPSASPLFLVGGAGPLIVAVVLNARERLEIRRDFWRRIADPRLIGGGWWLVVLGLHPALILVACGLTSVASDDPFVVAPMVSSAMTVTGIGALLSAAFFTFWFGPLPEEIGWRGFAQDRLVAWSSPLRASLLLGAVWALWHVPLFFVPGTFQHAMGIGHGRFWVFMLSMVPLSVIIGWVWMHTRRSTLGAALIHFAGNFASVCVVKSEAAALVELALLCVVALWVAARLQHAHRVSEDPGYSVDSGGRSGR